MIAKSRTLTDRSARILQSDLEVGDFARFQGNPNFLLSLARGLTAIEVFEGHTGGVSSAEISRRTGLSRAAVRRILMTLELLGYAESDGRVYRLKSRVMRLGFSYLSSSSLATLAQPILEHVIELVHESSSVGVLEGDQVVYVARATAKRVMSIGLSVGSRFPAYCTSMGRVLLSGLSEQELSAYFKRAELRRITSKTIVDKAVLGNVINRVRIEGFALNNEELELGHRSIAVPVKDRKGRMVAGMNIGVHAARVSIAEMKGGLLPILREHSQTLSQLLG
ncbi:MAG: IclR family transcriptional regulator C-terminal domain-containing protein [Candidatus Sulfotelmatobacter sp.]|jgi:IclR family pca regulon transcriptional regulator